MTLIKLFYSAAAASQIKYFILHISQINLDMLPSLDRSSCRALFTSSGETPIFRSAKIAVLLALSSFSV